MGSGRLSIYQFDGLGFASSLGPLVAAQSVSSGEVPEIRSNYLFFLKIISTSDLLTMFVVQPDGQRSSFDLSASLRAIRGVLAPSLVAGGCRFGVLVACKRVARSSMRSPSPWVRLGVRQRLPHASRTNM